MTPAERAVGRQCRFGGHTWRIMAELARHDGRFLYLRRDRGKRIFLREVLCEEVRPVGPGRRCGWKGQE